jgi:hypothetical protein
MLFTTILALLGLFTGLVLHLRWHPLRREFSDSWDFLRLRQPLVLLLGILILLGRPAPVFTLPELQDWRSLWPALLGRSFWEITELFHALMPTWPLAVALPFLLWMLAVRLWRLPYRYGGRRPVMEEKLALAGMSSAGLLWITAEISASRTALPEMMESARLAGRLVFEALAAAWAQVGLARLVMAWERPEHPQAKRDVIAALDGTFARWQSVSLLGAFNLTWMLCRAWQGHGPPLMAWLLPEFWLLFAALPLGVALAGHTSFWAAGAVALRMLLHCLPAMAGYLLTSLAAMTLVRHAVDLALLTTSAAGGIIHGAAQVLCALVLAMLRGWLFLAGTFVMLRHGFPRSTSADPAG